MTSPSPLRSLEHPVLFSVYFMHPLSFFHYLSVFSFVIHSKKTDVTFTDYIYIYQIS